MKAALFALLLVGCASPPDWSAFTVLQRIADCESGKIDCENH